MLMIHCYKWLVGPTNLVVDMDLRDFFSQVLNLDWKNEVRSFPSLEFLSAGSLQVALRESGNDSSGMLPSNSYSLLP